MNETISKIRAEIERRITDNTFGAKLELIDILAWLDTLESEKPIPKDLEEAAGEYAEKHGFRVPYDGSDNFYDDVDVKASKEGFIAGAKWQAGQMMKDGNVILAEEDFDAEKEKSVEWGYNLCEEQMMKDAVEGTIICYNDSTYSVESCCFDNTSHQHKSGDKVRIIIVKE